MRHIRRSYQPPYDYYRFTEYAENLFDVTGFNDIDIQHTGGFMAVIGYYFISSKGLELPSARKILISSTIILLNLYFVLDSLDNGYGRDMTLYFMIRACKKNDRLSFY